MSEGLFSWGNYPCYPQHAVRPAWREALPSTLARLCETRGTTLAYGQGRSYGDSCLAASNHLLHTAGLDRFIAVNWDAGIVRAEAGVTLADILAIAVPRGWFLPVTPGTKYVTLGGAIANDVHGKNHHRRGTFGRHVRALGLLRSDTGPHVCGPDDNQPLFCATVGGLGLTGIIEWAEIALVPIRSSRLSTMSRRFGDIDEFFALSNAFDPIHEFTVSWIDCTAHGRSAGRGIYTAADFAVDEPLAVETSRRMALPFTPPLSLVNALTVRAMNLAYWHKSPQRNHGTTGYDRFFYPLDGILHWNRAYGRHGFQQYQAVIPDTAARPALTAMLSAVAQSGYGSFLAVLKRCSDIASPGMMSFPMAGTSLALDFANRKGLDTLFGRLDAIVREAGGRLYPAKDAHMSATDFRTGYPAWEALEAMRDPALLSRFWKRVTQ